MHLKAATAVVALLAFCWVPDTGHAAGPTAAGLWEKRDDAGQAARLVPHRGTEWSL